MGYSNLTSKNRTLVNWFKFAAAGSLIALLTACGGGGGDDTAAAAPTTPVTPTAPAAIVTPPTAEAVALADTASTETCSLCHAGATPLARSGPGHQATYDELYQAGVIKITGLAYSFASPTSTLTFTMKKNGVAFDCSTLDAKKAAAIGSYWAAYDATAKKFKAAVAPSYLSLWPTTAKVSAASTATTKPTVTGTVVGDPATGACTRCGC